MDVINRIYTNKVLEINFSKTFDLDIMTYSNISCLKIDFIEEDFEKFYKIKEKLNMFHSNKDVELLILRPVGSNAIGIQKSIYHKYKLNRTDKSYKNKTWSEYSYIYSLTISVENNY